MVWRCPSTPDWPVTTAFNVHKNDRNSIISTNIELKLGVVVAESFATYTLSVTYCDIA